MWDYDTDPSRSMGPVVIVLFGEAFSLCSLEPYSVLIQPVNARAGPWRGDSCLQEGHVPRTRSDTHVPQPGERQGKELMKGCMTCFPSGGSTWSIEMEDHENEAG